MGRGRLVVERDPRRIAVPEGDTAPLLFESHPHAETLRALDVSVYLGERYRCALSDDKHIKAPVLVDTQAQLDELSKALSSAAVVGVDVEHHSFMSYHGLTCVVQLTAGETDYVVDAIRLRASLRGALGPAFADAAVLKVFHAAECDLQWLQRDFGLFVVGHFDTAAACRVLGAARHGLGSLVEAHFGVCLDKAAQLADWRVRPLPPALLAYAAADTRYLPALWSRLSLELGAQRTLDVLGACAAKAARTLWRPDAPAPAAWRALLPAPGGHGGRDVARAAALWAWRDGVARARDVSPPAVASNAVLQRLLRAGGPVAEWRSALRGVSDAEWRDLIGRLGDASRGAVHVPPPVPVPFAKRQHVFFDEAGDAVGAVDSGDRAEPSDEPDGAQDPIDSSADAKAVVDEPAAVPVGQKAADGTADSANQAVIDGSAVSSEAERPRPVRVRTAAGASALAGVFGGGAPRAPVHDDDGRAAVAARMGISRAMRAAAALEASRYSIMAGPPVDSGAAGDGGAAGPAESGPQLSTPDPKAVALVRPGARIALSGRSAESPRVESRIPGAHAPPAGVLDLAAAAARLSEAPRAEPRQRHAAEGAPYRPGRAAMPRSASRAMSFRRR